MYEQQEFTLAPLRGGTPRRRRGRRPRLPGIDAGHLIAVIVLVVAVLALLIVARSKGAHPQAPVDVPIELRGWPGGPAGVMPIVRVRIGDGPPIPVVLDTGSTGLMVLAGKVPSGSHVWPMGDELTETWGGGAVTRGRRTLADVTIGGIATTAPVIIGLVNAAGCIGGGSACVPWLGHAKVDGILGIRLASQGIIANPLLSLPAPYGQSWRIALSGLSGTLELGAAVPRHPVAALSASTHPSPSPLVNAADLPTLCWRVRVRAPRACVPTLFDTGSTDAVLFSHSSAPPLHLLPAGVPVTGSTPAGDHAPLWNFTSGTSASEDLVLTNGAGLSLMDTGIAPFYSFNFTYDAAQARTYLTRADPDAGEPAWRRGAEALCRQGLAVAETQLHPLLPDGQRATLAERKQAFINYLNTWGRMSLRLDDAFARLQPPAALSGLWGRGLASDRRASQTMLQSVAGFARVATSPAFVQEVRDFEKRYIRAEAGWETMMKQVKLAGCS